MTEWNPVICSEPRCRSEFEKWAVDHGIPVHPMYSMDAYFDSETDRAWIIWQSAWMSSKVNK